MPKLLATHSSPAEKPTAVPNTSDGRGPRKLAKFQAASSASTKDSPKIRAELPLASTSSESPVARCHALPNSTGEYHNPPSTKHAMAATITAIQLISGMSASLCCCGGILRPVRRAVLEKTEMGSDPIC